MTIYRVTVGGKEYQVEIEDVNVQPVRTVVNGHVVQVWTQKQGQTAPSLPIAVPMPVPSSSGVAAEAGVVSELEVRAPMPGSVVSVEVQPGEQVELGQNLCFLDAMKMHNLIRAPRDGTVAQVHVRPGQQVQQGDLLVSFAGEE